MRECYDRAGISGRLPLLLRGPGRLTCGAESTRLAHLDPSTAPGMRLPRGGRPDFCCPWFCFSRPAAEPFRRGTTRGWPGPRVMR
jgi:hypothetical protein